MTKPITKAQRAELLELERNATPGPWGDNMGDICTLTDAGKGYPLNFYPDSIDVTDIYDRDEPTFLSAANLAIVIAARNAIGAYESRVVELEAQLATAVEALGDADKAFCQDCKDGFGDGCAIDVRHVISEALRKVGDD